MSKFNKWVFISLASVYFLIFVGSLVRASGAGMGCPDWPKCYGQIIPPTSQDQIPEGLEEILTDKRIAKYERFLKVVNALGLNSFLLIDGYDIKASQPFNAVKTWIEYLNRICGVIVGLTVLMLVYQSIRLREKRGKYLTWSLVLLFITLLEGFIGSLVVAANLLPGIITVHMFFALIMVGVLIMMYVQTREDSYSMNFGSWTYMLAMVIVFGQVLMGTGVREEVDLLLKSIGRENVIENLGIGFIIHRSFSWLLLLGSVYLYLKTPVENVIERKLNFGALVMIGVSFVTGILMSYVHLPFIIQPIHLVQATVLLGIYFYQFYSSRLQM